MYESSISLYRGINNNGHGYTPDEIEALGASASNFSIAQYSHHQSHNGGKRVPGLPVFLSPHQAESVIRYKNFREYGRMGATHWIAKIIIPLTLDNRVQLVQNSAFESSMQDTIRSDWQNIMTNQHNEDYSRPDMWSEHYLMGYDRSLPGVAEIYYQPSGYLITGQPDLSLPLLSSTTTEL